MTGNNNLTDLLNGAADELDMELLTSSQLARGEFMATSQQLREIAEHARIVQDQFDCALAVATGASCPRSYGDTPAAVDCSVCHRNTAEFFAALRRILDVTVPKIRKAKRS